MSEESPGPIQRLRQWDRKHWDVPSGAAVVLVTALITWSVRPFGNPIEIYLIGIGLGLATVVAGEILVRRGRNVER